MTAASLSEFDCGFTSIDDFIESLIPEVPQALCDDSLDSFGSNENNEFDRLTERMNTSNDNNNNTNNNNDADIIRPLPCVVDPATFIQLVDTSEEIQHIPRHCVRSSSTSSVVNSPPLSPVTHIPVTDIKVEGQHCEQYDNKNTISFAQGAFSPWELQKVCDKKYRYDPKPLLRKNRRQLVPEQEKNHKYWQRRQRNNKAARKSREDRRQKELEVVQTMSVLQQENHKLKVYVGNILKSNEQLQLDIIRMRQQLELAGFFVPANQSQY